MTTMQPNAALDARDQQLIGLMVTGNSQRECAERTRMHRTTVQRRAKRPAFQQALAVAEAEVTRAARRRLAESLTALADVLVRHAEDPDVPPAVRVAAAGRLWTVWASLQPREIAADVTVAQAGQRSSGRSLFEYLDHLAERRQETDAFLKDRGYRSLTVNGSTNGSDAHHG